MNSTADKIKKAIISIDKGRPKIVANERGLSITSVAEEAGIHRTTIINRYPQLAEMIRERSDVKDLKKDNVMYRVKKVELELKEAKSQIILLKSQLSKAISVQAQLLIK